MNNVIMFNFDKDWNLVEPHLNDPDIQNLLDQGMREFCSRKKVGKVDWDKDSDKAPWLYYIGELWHFVTTDRMEKSKEYSDYFAKYHNLAKDLGYKLDDIFDRPEEPELCKLVNKFHDEGWELYERFCPQHNTYEWYQCWGAERYLALWQKALAEKIFPEYKWENYYHKVCCDDGSAAIGTGSDGYILIFDIFSFNRISADKVLGSAGLIKSNLAA